MADTYHHGDLRRALLDAAHRVIETQGVGALSLRDLARRVQVSPTAPYHHFQGKAALVEALCEDAFEGLDRALTSDLGDPEERLRAQGIAYVLHAVDHPALFRLAFRPEMGSPFAALAAGDGPLPDDVPAFRRLIATVSEIESDPAERTRLAVAAWSLVHGLAALLVDGPLAALATDRSRVEALARSVVGRLSLRS